MHCILSIESAKALNLVSNYFTAEFRMKSLISSGVVSLVLLASASASAAVCVQVDEARDNLDPAERTAVKTMVEESLRGQNQSVSDTNCDTTYKIYSLRLGNSVTANISGPNGSKSQKASSIEELPETYDQLTRSLLNGETGSTATAGVNRHNVTKQQAVQRRIVADNLWFLRLGYGAVAGGDFASGPAFGLGYRYELDQLGIEISTLNIVAATDGSSDDGLGVSASWIRLGGLYFFNPVANHSAYLNVGLSWGTSASRSQYQGESYIYSGSGIQGEIGGGYEFLRASTIRMFVEANAVLPFYTSSIDWSIVDDSIYTPTFTISLGVGYGSSNRSAVEIY